MQIGELELEFLILSKAPGTAGNDERQAHESCIAHKNPPLVLVVGHPTSRLSTYLLEATRVAGEPRRSTLARRVSRTASRSRRRRICSSCNEICRCCCLTASMRT